MKPIASRILSCALALLAGMPGLVPGEQWKPRIPGRIVSIVRLLAEDQRLADTVVRTEGVLSIDTEYQHLCLAREHAEKVITANCVLLDLTQEELAPARALNGQYVVVEGTYRPGPFVTTIVLMDQISEIVGLESDEKVRFEKADGERNR